MVYVKNKFFFIMLCFFSSICPVQNKNNYEVLSENLLYNSLITGALGLSSYVAWSCNIPEEFYVKYTYPYAQLWYEEMATKYPQANFDKRKFLCACRGLLSNTVFWEGAYNDMYAPVEDLQKIDAIYQKKQRNKDLTDDEINLLYMCEFLLLREAGHIENSESLNRLMAYFAISSGVEFFKYGYRERYSYNPVLLECFSQKLYLDSLLGKLFSVFTYYSYVRHRAALADDFACQHADGLEVLQGGLKFFNYLTQMGIIDAEHPFSQSRAQAVFDEIQKRKGFKK